ncbi:8947_t:CDS:2, partial [Gigaspora margarita]
EMTPTFAQAGHNLKAIWMKEIGFNYEFNSTTTETELAKAYNFVTSRDQSALYLYLSRLLPFIRKLPTRDNNKFYDSVNTINNISERLLADQKNSPVQGTDLLSLLVKANYQLPVNEQLTHREVVSSVMTFLMAGHDTATVVISWALYLLASNPDSQDRLRKELLDIFPDRDYHPTFDQIEQLKFLDCTVKEILRFIPPGKNTPLSISVYAIHHDPSIWGVDAESFNPSRWLNPEITPNITNYNFIPFNTGPRTCVGIKMATLEVKTILAVIIRNFEFKLVEGFTFGVKSVSVAKPIPGIDLLVSR